MKRSAVSGTLVLFPGSSRSSGTGAPGGRRREPIREETPPVPVSRDTVAADLADRKALLDAQLARHAALDQMLAGFIGQHHKESASDPRAKLTPTADRAPSREEP